ncbi:hypothetical protein HanXRQr2_Chr13g0603891 [Helianthus annuus]|uniref:Retrovirus-related Pol polyprotein from transposon TNT 1-94-like beta-barrel domain-containing protein n=1 Tax=Helianthus annuus TaxID=4232 RepID=A0A9K3HD88_HELAN|nr:hypothetical protein HanXRQr2_Chr13g0603891 [Helianthus annuus]KAJ0850531.1 hypothetical protein HanPSC8_Chr13g0581921 [Helianthus annuus]
MLMKYIWDVDNGWSRHMTGLKELLKNFCFIDGDYVSFTGDEKGGKIVGIGDVVSEALTLENVNYVPELCYNLMSVSQVSDKGISVPTTWNKTKRNRGTKQRRVGRFSNTDE